MAPRLPMRSAFKMCGSNETPDAHVEMLKESPISGYLSASSQVYDTFYKVPLKHGIRNQEDKKRGREDGHNTCKMMCTKTWDKAEVPAFQMMVKRGYGYRLYLDDLPSATKYDGQDHYDENVPIGYDP